MPDEVTASAIAAGAVRENARGLVGAADVAWLTHADAAGTVGVVVAGAHHDAVLGAAGVQRGGDGRVGRVTWYREIMRVTYGKTYPRTTGSGLRFVGCETTCFFHLYR